MTQISNYNQLTTLLSSQLKVNINKSVFTRKCCKLYIETIQGHFVSTFTECPYWLITAKMFNSFPKEVYKDFEQAYNQTPTTTNNLRNRCILNYTPPVKAHKKCICLDYDTTIAKLKLHESLSYVLRVAEESINEHFAYAKEVQETKPKSFQCFLEDFMQASCLAYRRDKSYYKFIDSFKHLKDKKSLLYLLDLNEIYISIFREYQGINTNIHDKYEFFSDYLSNCYPIKAMYIYNKCKKYIHNINNLKELNWTNVCVTDEDAYDRSRSE